MKKRIPIPTQPIKTDANTDSRHESQEDPNKNSLNPSRNISIYLSKNHLTVLKFLCLHGFGKNRSDLIRKSVINYFGVLDIERELLQQITKDIQKSEADIDETH
jgi:hypothetical protein